MRAGRVDAMSKLCYRLSSKRIMSLQFEIQRLSKVLEPH